MPPVRLVDTTFDIMLGHFTDYVRIKEDEGTIMFDEARDAHLGVFPNVKLMYKGWLDEPAQRNLETKYEGLKEIAKDTTTAFHMLFGSLNA